MEKVLVNVGDITTTDDGTFTLSFNTLHFTYSILYYLPV